VCFFVKEGVATQDRRNDGHWGTGNGMAELVSFVSSWNVSLTASLAAITAGEIVLLPGGGGGGGGNCFKGYLTGDKFLDLGFSREAPNGQTGMRGVKGRPFMKSRKMVEGMEEAGRSCPRLEAKVLRRSRWKEGQ